MTQWQPSTRDAGFVGSIPESYDRYLRPLLFDGSAAELAARVVLPRGRAASVLELGTGTGALTRQLRTRLPNDTTMTATDLNEPMLAVAQRQLEALGLANGVSWRVADAMALPFDDGAFDVVASQFVVMFFPDKPRAAREAFRVLRPGGQWIFSVFGSWEENPFGRILHETIASFFPDDPPQFYRVPFGYHDPEALRALALAAGFEEPEITVVNRVAELPSAEQAAIGFVRGNPVITEVEERGTAEPDEVCRAVADRFASTFGDHPLRFPTRFRIVSARKAAES